MLNMNKPGSRAYLLTVTILIYVAFGLVTSVIGVIIDKFQVEYNVPPLHRSSVQQYRALINIMGQFQVYSVRQLPMEQLLDFLLVQSVTLLVWEQQ